MTIINQSYTQRKSSNYACKLALPNFKSWSITDLNEQLVMINSYKDSLSEYIGWYLKNDKAFNCKLDIERKCRALGIPAFLSGINTNTPELGDTFERIINTLKSHAMRMKSGKIVRPCRVDINELCVYSKMYQDIELVKDKIFYYFPKGNPFEYIMDLMQLGAVIIRFKYVKIGLLPPQEKLITYHLWRNKRLLVHIEGDDYFIGWKYWGEGDEKIRNIFGENDIKIRWGIDDFDKKKRFIY